VEDEVSMGYVVSKSGTFGIVKRTYTTEAGEPCIVISWGPLGWITPVPERDCMRLRSSYEAEARAEAEQWVARIEAEEQRNAALDRLAQVMHTLRASAASPADQAIYDEARALLAEHGRVGVPQEMAEAHREWEGRR
jgi:hypothetical protein